MATQAIDFKKINSKGYKVWRIIQAPGAWGQIYRDRELKLRNYKSALIFPEQLLGLNQKLIYKVQVHRLGSTVSSHITGVRCFCPADANRKALTTAQEVYDYEADNAGDGEVHRLNYATPNQTGDSVTFYTSNLFSSIKDAEKFQRNQQASLLSQIG
jgi:hypothetical protein